MKFEEMINNVILGDCYEVIRNIPDKSIDCIYVDVPYLYIQHGGCKSEIGKRSAKRELELLGLEQKDYDDTKGYENLRIARNRVRCNEELKSQDLTSGFDYQEFIKEAFRIMKKCNMFIWCSRMQILDLMNEIHKYCDSTIDILVWCKTNPIPAANNLWLSDVEYCLYVRDKNVKLNDGYELKSKWYISPINQGDKVKTKRRYIGIEVNPKWHKIAIDRLNGIEANGQMTIFSFEKEEQ